MVYCQGPYESNHSHCNNCCVFDRMWSFKKKKMSSNAIFHKCTWSWLNNWLNRNSHPTKRRLVSSAPPCNCHFTMCLHGETRNCLLNGSIVLLLLFVVAQIQKEHQWIVVIVYCRSCISQIRSKHKGSWDLTRQASSSSIVGVSLPAQFSSSDSSFWEFILYFILLLLLRCDGSADRRCLQRLWPQWVFFYLLPHHRMLCLRATSWPCRAILTSILSSSVGFFAETVRKGSVVSRANSIGSTSASSVPNTGKLLYFYLDLCQWLL